MEKEYTIKSVKMISPKSQMAQKILDGTIEEIEIPENITKIPSGIFNSCINLKRVILPKSITKIEDWSFENCSSLKEIEYQGSVSDWNSISLSVWWNDRSSITTIICNDGNITIQED